MRNLRFFHVLGAFRACYCKFTNFLWKTPPPFLLCFDRRNKSMFAYILLMMKTLHRSSRHKVLFGVCGGLAEYFGVDPVAIRIVMVLLGLMGAGILFYLAAVFIMPPDTLDQKTETPENPKPSSAPNIALIIGAVLVIIGVCFL